MKDASNAPKKADSGAMAEGWGSRPLEVECGRILTPCRAAQRSLAGANATRTDARSTITERGARCATHRPSVGSWIARDDRTCSGACCPRLAESEFERQRDLDPRRGQVVRRPLRGARP